jgi:hypothetical protein
VGKINKIQFGVVEKKLCNPNGFILFLGSAGRTTYTKGKIWWPCPKKWQGWLSKKGGKGKSQAPFGKAGNENHPPCQGWQPGRQPSIACLWRQ